MTQFQQRELDMSIKIFFTGINAGTADNLGVETGLTAIARRQGYDICVGVADAPDLVICVDYDKRFDKILKEASKAKVPLVLVKQEPKVVCPAHRFENPKGIFNLVIKRAAEKNVPIFPAHQDWDTSFLHVGIRRKKVIAISSDKWSFVPGELYSLRLKMYSQDVRIDLFGNGWGQPNWNRALLIAKELIICVRACLVPSISNLAVAFLKPLNFKGIAKNKLEVLSAYHASLVIENDESSMSEKLIDCILAGTIPIYVGPPVLAFNIPDDLVIHSKSDTSSIQRAMDEALRWDSKEYRSRAWDWASQDITRSTWDSEEVGIRLLAHVIDRILSIDT